MKCRWLGKMGQPGQRHEGGGHGEVAQGHGTIDMTQNVLRC